MYKLITGLVLAITLLLGGCATSSPATSTTPASQASTTISASVNNTDLAAIRQCNRPAGLGISLTFDDYGTPKQIHAILAKLREHNIRAAFFPTGEWAEQHMDLIREMQADGHIVGNHTYTHAPLGKLINSGKADDEAKFYGEIYPTEGVANTTPMLLRPPFEDGAYDPKVGAIMTDKQYQLCTWTADTYDWHGDSVAVMMNRLILGDKYSPTPLGEDGVVLMHMHGKYTPQLIDAIVAYAIQRKLLFERRVG